MLSAQVAAQLSQSKSLGGTSSVGGSGGRAAQRSAPAIHIQNATSGSGSFDQTGSYPARPFLLQPQAGAGTTTPTLAPAPGLGTEGQLTMQRLEAENRGTLLKTTCFNQQTWFRLAFAVLFSGYSFLRKGAQFTLHLYCTVLASCGRGCRLPSEYIWARR
jgi:hypothetical protein